jgi:hypothetical protein
MREECSGIDVGHREVCCCSRMGGREKLVVSQKVGHVKHCFGLGPEHFYTLRYLVASNKEHI